MTTPTTNAPAPTASPLDAVLGKIDQMLAPPPAPVVDMTQAQLHEHVAAELEKALVEQADPKKAETAKARLAHLKSVVAAAKAIYDKGATLAQITMFKDPWQTMPGEGAAKSTIDVPQPAITPTGDSNVQFMQDVVVVTEKGRTLSPTFKALFSIAKAPADSAIRKALVAKAGATVAPAIIAKAGEALACLEKIATIFGYTPEPGESLLDCDFRWSVEDTVRALQNAARTESVIAQMTGLLGATTTKSALLAAPAETPAPAAGAAPAAPGAPAAGAPPAAPAPAAGDDGAWPLDMSSSVLDDKTGLQKNAGDKDGKLYWGRDSESAPKD